MCLRQLSLALEAHSTCRQHKHRFKRWQTRTCCSLRKIHVQEISVVELHVVTPLHFVATVQEPDTTSVCVLAVPGDMGAGEFCRFLSSYMPLMVSMRMVRREQVAKGTCLAAIDFKDAATAKDFVRHYNGRPFNEIEPEIICRAVFTTAVEIHQPDDDASAPSAGTPIKAPPGHVELPTCPVCLDRLDADVSGVVTTVCLHLCPVVPAWEPSMALCHLTVACPEHRLCVTKQNAC